MTTDLPWTGGGSVHGAHKTTISDLANGKSYNVQVRACNGPERCGDWSDSATGTLKLKLGAPSNLDVTPLPERMIKLTWTASHNKDDNTGYLVHIEDPNSSDTIWRVTPNHLNASVEHELHLSDLVDGFGLDKEDYFKIWIVATDGARPKVKHDSPSSEEIFIIDTPIIAANGHSPNLGQAKLKWRTMASVLGDTSYFGGMYSFQYRREGGDHTLSAWRPGKYPYVSDSTVDQANMMGTNRDTIGGLTKEGLYAVQLRYEKAEKPDVFAARDVYVWPSGSVPGPGDRVATFPLNHPVPRKTFEYRICTDYLPEDTKNDWVRVVKHALGQWQEATDGLVTMEPVDELCALYAGEDPTYPNRRSILEEVKNEINARMDGDSLDLSEHGNVLAFLRGLDGFTLVRGDDYRQNEVKLIDIGDFPKIAQAVGTSVLSSFPELAEDVGFAECVFKVKNYGCAIPLIDRSPMFDNLREDDITTDIFLNLVGIAAKRNGNELPPPVPGGDDIPKRSDAPFNSCPQGVTITPILPTTHCCTKPGTPWASEAKPIPIGE